MEKSDPRLSLIFLKIYAFGLKSLYLLVSSYKMKRQELMITVPLPHKSYKMKIIKTVFLSALTISASQQLHAQDVHLHVNTQWEECSIQLDSTLSQGAWHQFTKEAGMVVYFRPLHGAETLAPGKFELSVLQWNTGIDETQSAWNETFVHPDTTHYLIGGDELPFPGLTLRAGISDKMDAGVYYTKSPGANYNIFAAQVQYNLFQNNTQRFYVSGRAGFSTIFGPDDLGYEVFGIDAITSKEFSFANDHLGLTPYALASAVLTHAHEKSDIVELDDENLLGGQAAIGAEARIFFARLGVEYNWGPVNTMSYKLGVVVKL